MGKYIPVQGWGLEEIPGMIAGAGTRKSSGNESDSDAGEEDPIWNPRHDYMSEQEVVEWFNATHRQSFESLMNSEEIQTFLTALAMSIADIAARMTHKDICVIFGRDCYPAQEFVKTWIHKLRGTWIYIEGVSSRVSGEKKLWEFVEKLLKPLIKRGAIVYGMDTGFDGLVPYSALSLIRNKRVCMVVANGIGHRTIRTYSNDTGGSLRTSILRLEGAPKPFLRTKEIDNGVPVLRLARRKDITYAAAILLVARVIGLELLPLLPEFFSDYNKEKSSRWLRRIANLRE